MIRVNELATGEKVRRLCVLSQFRGTSGRCQSAECRYLCSGKLKQSAR